jgi:hypothetical protein
MQSARQIGPGQSLIADQRRGTAGRVEKEATSMVGLEAEAARSQKRFPHDLGLYEAMAFDSRIEGLLKPGRAGLGVTDVDNGSLIDLHACQLVPGLRPAAVPFVKDQIWKDGNMP